MRNKEVGSTFLEAHDYSVQMLISLYIKALSAVGPVVNNQVRDGPQGE